jgi:glycogen synthase
MQCANCDATTTIAINPDPAGHAWGEWYVAREATCVTKGVEKRICSKCDAVDRRTTPATGVHVDGDSYTYEAPTCEGEGKLAERLVKRDPYVDGAHHHVTVLEGRRDGHIRTLYMHADCLLNGLGLNDDHGIRASVVYAHAVCAWLSQATRAYDVVHCDGMETAIIPTIMRKFYAHDARVAAVKSVVSVKGIEDKAGIPMYWMEKIGFSADMASSDGMEFYGKLSILKGAYLHADAIAFPNACIKRRIEKNRGKDIGMEGVLFDKLDKLYTIGRGICGKCANPETDKAIEANYSIRDMSGKTKCKNALTLKYRLKKGQPVVAYIGNLDADSGLSLVNDILDDLMDNKVNLVIAGTGTDNQIKTVNGWKDEFKGQIAFLNEKPSCEDVRRILSAADILLLPPKHENTCTLHLAAMRYNNFFSVYTYFFYMEAFV